MAWIKRNLIFVITAAVGLILTGYCGYLLYSALNHKSAVGDDYTQTLNSLNEMRQKKPYPDKGNIQVAKQDQDRVRQFLGDFRKAFAPFPDPPAEDARGFKDYLQRSIFELGAEATNANVMLPDNYAFSWSQQRERLDYPPECIGPWMQQLQEEKTILHILYDARINFLEYIRRVPAQCDDQGGSDYISSSAVSNQWGVVTPYAIGFRGFSTELAAVMAGFAKATNCFIVKEVEVTPSKAQLPQVIAPTPPPAQVQPAYNYNYAQPQPINPYLQPANPYLERGRGGRGRMPTPQYPYPYAQPQGQVGAPLPAAPVTILAENPLYITMAIDVVKLK